MESSGIGPMAVLLFVLANVAVAILLRLFNVKMFHERPSRLMAAISVLVVLVLPTVGIFWLALDFLGSTFLQDFRNVADRGRIGACAILAFSTYGLVFFFWGKK